jgi:tetratricopeptide (TPR) repeat protein
MRGIAQVSILVTFSAIGAPGCIKKTLLEGQITSTRQASEAINTIHDYEIARSVASAGIGQLEGMHRLAPDNADALFMLTRGWAGLSFGFAEDDYEAAHETGDSKLAQYHLARARAGYQRAVHYGLELLAQSAEGFAQAKANQQSLRAWLVENFEEPEQSEDLLWTGYAWIGHVSASKEIPEIVGELYVGVEIVRRAVELDERAVHALGHTILGSYHARTAMAELDKSKEHFDRALALNGGKFLATKLNLAIRYHCAKSDRGEYERLLREVLQDDSDLPTARLQNAIAKRRARRYLGNSMWQEECGFGT